MIHAIILTIAMSLRISSADACSANCDNGITGENETATDTCIAY